MISASTCFGTFTIRASEYERPRLDKSSIIQSLGSKYNEVGSEDVESSLLQAISTQQLLELIVGAEEAFILCSHWHGPSVLVDFQPNAPGSKEPEPYAGTEQLPGSYPQQPSASSSSPGTSATEREPPPPQQPPPHTPSSGQHDVGTNEGAAAPPPPLYPPPAANNYRHEAAPANMLHPAPRYPANIPDAQMQSPPQQQAAQAMPPPYSQAVSQPKTRRGPARFNCDRAIKPRPHHLSRQPRALAPSLASRTRSSPHRSKPSSTT
ncbi:hypothetical protein Pst134EB_024989 [Puccinia striiformis f. sp. tritici]|nr:hypothetical protein Pst134EB_024989 [Puccinia striiformis f. sp. tritici]